MGTPAPDAVKRLVDRFDSERKVFQSGDYKEEQLRAEFLNPFFTALGWDMDNALDTIQNRNWGNVPLLPLFCPQNCLVRQCPRYPPFVRLIFAVPCPPSPVLCQRFRGPGIVHYARTGSPGSRSETPASCRCGGRNAGPTCRSANCRRA
jgi:hypothetical protein